MLADRRPVGRRSRCARRGMIRRRWPQRNSSRTCTRMGSRVNASGQLEVGGCDVVELAREFGTPAYVYAEDDIRARARAFVRGLRGPHRRLRGPLRAARRSPAPPSTGCFAEEGPRLRRRLRRRARTGAARPASTPRASTCTATTSPTRSCATRCEAGVGHLIVDNRATWTCSSARPALLDGRPQPVADPGHARGQPRHPPYDLDRRSSTRSSASASPTRRGRRSSGRWRRRALELVGLHAHIGSQIFELEPFRAALARARRARRSLRRSYNVGGGLGIAYGAARRAAVDRGLRRRQGRRASPSSSARACGS